MSTEAAHDALDADPAALDVARRMAREIRYIVTFPGPGGPTGGYTWEDVRRMDAWVADLEAAQAERKDQA